MKILLFGGSGQVGQELQTRADKSIFRVFAPTSSIADVSDYAAVLSVTSFFKPDIIINSAAYTAVDLAESNPDLAFKVNATGALNTAKAAKQRKTKYIYLSSDYVFSGSGITLLREDDNTHPINVYGHTKLAGEQAVQAELGDAAVIVRTSAVHGQFGKNIVHLVCKLLEQNDPLDFINDQIMSPTWASWLADVLLKMSLIPCQGIYHASSMGAVSWYDIAKLVLSIATEARPEWMHRKISAIKALDAIRPAKRPKFTAFDTSKLTKLIKLEPITWEQGVKLHMEQIGFATKSYSAQAKGFKLAAQ